MVSEDNKSIAIYTGGGDAPGMNAALRSSVRLLLLRGWRVFGIKQAYKGLVEDQFIFLDVNSVGQIIHRGGTILQSIRFPEFKDKVVREKAYKNLKKRNISALVCIGGDGSFRGAYKCFEESQISVVGIPATIDNDIFGTDISLGFDTASNTALDAVDRIRETADSHGRVFLIEVMGHRFGELALRVGLACGAEDVFLPHMNVGYLDQAISNIKERVRRGKRGHIFIVAEGSQSGRSYEIAKKIRAKSNLEVKVCVLGHVQRGGAPSSIDRALGSIFGVKAVEALESMDVAQAKAVVYSGGITKWMDLKDIVENQKKEDVHFLSHIKSLA